MTLKVRSTRPALIALGLVAALVFLSATAGAQPPAGAVLKNLEARFSTEKAFDVSPPLRDLARRMQPRTSPLGLLPEPLEIRPERGPIAKDKGFAGDGAVRAAVAGPLAPVAPAIPLAIANFEGISNQDNFNIFGFRVNPPDPVGDVGPYHYVEMVNLAYAVYDKSGNKLMGPTDIGLLWDGFAITDCREPSGDPIVLYDQLSDRWLLSQFTTRGPEYFNCVAISQTGDPTGAYYRYAFSAGLFFPDYPKYGVWNNSYLLTSRDFGPTVEYGISVYALERNKMVNGETNVRAVQFFLDSDVVPINLIGDGLLPADVDGLRRPRDGAPAPIIGTQDNDGPYGATSDALNVFELSVQWKGPQTTASLALVSQIPVASFDSIFPCGLAPGQTARDCIPQPPPATPTAYLDILSYRQRPTWRLAYRNFGKYEAMVTNQSVEASPGMAGVRWYEIRRTDGTYSLQQQGTYAPSDGVHRWMGSIAMDAVGNMLLGYSVSSLAVFPGIRYTGRLSGDPLGQMTISEGTIMNGTGVQRTTNSRWGDYTSMNIDPADDCTFWYVNEYYTAAGQASSTAGWQTRIASFKIPGCVARQ